MFYATKLPEIKQNSGDCPTPRIEMGDRNQTHPWTHQFEPRLKMAGSSGPLLGQESLGFHGRPIKRKLCTDFPIRRRETIAKPPQVFQLAAIESRDYYKIPSDS